MSTIAELFVKLGLDSSAFKRGIDEAKTHVKSINDVGQDMTAFGGKMVKTGGMISLSMAPATLIYKGMITNATDLGEQQAKTTQIFEDSSGAIIDWADNTTEAFGISKLEALEFAGNYGNILTNMGLTDEAAAGMSKTLIELAADQAAFNNLGTEEVLGKLESALVGEYMPVRQLGIVMYESSVKAKALQMGLADANGEVSTGALVQARAAMIIEQSGSAMGQFARESDGLAAQQKITKATFSDLKAELGAKLLPIMLKVMTALQKMINWFSGLSPGAQKAILAIGGFLIILGPVLVILGGLISAIGAIITFLTGPAIAAIGGAIAAAMPVIAVVVGIIAAVALLKTAWENNWGGIQEKTAVVVDWIKGKVQAFLDAIQAFWDKHGAKITEVVTKIWDGIKRVFDIFFGFIQGIVDTFLLILQGDFKGAGENLRETFINTWQKIKSLFSDLLKGIINTFKNIDWAQLGRDIINGIINGLKNAAQWLYNTISNIAGGVIDFAKGILGIESPSKVFAEIGEQINKGMALGINATVDLPENALSIPGVRSVTSMPAQTRGDAELAKLFGIDYERMALIIRDAVMQVQR
jgi:hypothetical protein